MNHSAIHHRQRGGTALGLLIGLVMGLAIALAVAVYVTKVPMPFMNKGQTRSPEQDAAEVRKNKDWDPNSPLYGKNPARRGTDSADAKDGGKDAGKDGGKEAGKAEPKPDARSEPGTDAKPEAQADAKPESKADAKPAEEQAPPFQFFLQVGAFRTAAEAEAQKVKLALAGFETRVFEREQSGRTVFRVRIGPFDRKEEAERQRERLEAASIESALVRVQR